MMVMTTWKLFNQVGVSNIVHLNQDKRRRGNNSRSIKQGNERKTRLSWELHPTLLLHDLELELEALDNGSHHIFDDGNDEEASEEAATPGPRATVARGERV
jgi:hypothetical protein